MSSRAAEFDSARIFSPDQVLLPALSYRSFSYPGDEQALAALERVPGASALLTYLQTHFTEQLTYVENNEQMIRVSSGNYPSIYKLVSRCAEILSCPAPEVFVTNNPVMRSYTVGHRRISLVLHSALIEGMSADELSFVIGHELGYVKCGHGLYRQLGDILLPYWDAVASLIPIPGIGLIRVPLLLAFWEWYRKAELTCDRAGLLCVQAVDPAKSALGKLAGRIAGFEDEFDINSAMSQSASHRDLNKLVLVVSILNSAQNMHPFVPGRLKQIADYGQSDEYHRILSGQYLRDLLVLPETAVRIRCACGAENSLKLNYCPRCGRPINPAPKPPSKEESAPPPLACANCANELTDDMRFCPRCGARTEVVPMATAQ